MAAAGGGRRGLVRFDQRIRAALTERVPRYEEIERNVRRVARLVVAAGVRETARVLGMSTNTVMKYRRLAALRGLLDEDGGQDEDSDDPVAS